MVMFDAFIRFSGVGLLGLLAVYSARDLRNTRSAPYLFLASLSVMAAYVGFTIEPFRLPETLNMLVRFVDIPHLVFVWLFALSLFQRNFKLRWHHVAVGVIYSLPILATRFYQFEIAAWNPQPFVYTAEFFSVALMIHLIATTLLGRADDLLEGRRRARVYFVLIISFVAIAAALVEASDFRPPGMAFQTLWIATVWPGIAWTCFWILGAKPEVLSFSGTPPAKKTSQDDAELLARLETIMTSDEAFRSPDLKITTLAKKLAVTQHRLRALINQTLGYQNFNSFINDYRISAAKKAMQDPATNALPILTIAMDCGFNSISPFNRAFRESENMTPSQYRRSLKPSIPEIPQSGRLPRNQP